MSKKLLLFITCSFCLTMQPSKCSNKVRDMLLESVYNQLEGLKYALDVIITRIEIFEFKTTKLLKPFVEGNRTLGELCDSDGQKSIKTLLDDTELIKLTMRQNNIQNVLNDLAAYLSEKHQHTDSNEDTDPTDDTEDILKQVLSKQTSMEKDLQTILQYNAKINEKFSKAAFTLHDEHLNCLENCNDITRTFGSCKSAQAANLGREGAYLIKIRNSELPPFFVYCLQNLMIVQRREDGSENFFRSWKGYKSGFGDVFREYWIGLDRLHALTNGTPHLLVVEFKTADESVKLAEYSYFHVGNEEQGYELKLGSFSGNATNALERHNGMKFSTFDQDNDESLRNCAREHKGAWWYKNCFDSNLNGKYPFNGDKGSLYWHPQAVPEYSYVHMAIIPLDELTT